MPPRDDAGPAARQLDGRLGAGRAARRAGLAAAAGRRPAGARRGSTWPAGWSSRDNPLVARVLVNRLWKLAFGQGLVTTLDDFGSQGAWPTHPELLDWLAVEFVDGGWDVKAIAQADRDVGRPIGSRRAPREADRAARPGQPLARRGRTRSGSTPSWSATTPWRSAGCSSPEIGGPSVKPYQPPGYWVVPQLPQARVRRPTTATDQYRRGLYTYWQRTFLHPSLLAFDAPTREECAVAAAAVEHAAPGPRPAERPDLRRGGARAWPTRLIARGRDRRRRPGSTAPSGWPWPRPPRPAEVAVLLRLLREAPAAVPRRPGRGADAAGASASARLPPDLDPAELAAWTSVARVLLNLHETITRN